MIEQIRNVVKKRNGGIFRSRNEHTSITIKGDGSMACSYDAMPGYAVPSARDRYVLVPAGRVKKKTRLALKGHSWLFDPALLQELGLK